MITERDISVLRFINQFGFSSTSMVQSVFFKNLANSCAMRVTRRRIQHLHERGLLKKQTHPDFSERIYSLTQSGSLEIERRGFESIKGLDHINWSEFHHDFEIQKIYLRFRDLGYTKFYSERKAREETPFGELIPDLIMFKSDNRTVMIEVELTRKTYKRMEEKLKEYIDSPHLGTLLYICKTDGIVTAISKTAKKFDELNGRFNAMTVSEFFSKNSDDFIHSIMLGKVC